MAGPHSDRPANLSWRVLDRAPDTLLTGSTTDVEGWNQQQTGHQPWVAPMGVTVTRPTVNECAGMLPVPALSILVLRPGCNTVCDIVVTGLVTLR